MEAIERDVGPIVLAVFNAGNYFPTKVERFAAENVIKTFEINVFGAVYGLAPVLEVMRSRGRGQVGLVGSVSGYFGLPAAAAYGASKAAINNFAWSLKYDLDRMNIRIQVFNPGFIDTPLTEKNDFTMPALMPVEKAAQRMADGIRTGGTEITFPRRFTYVLKALTLLPNSWTYAIYRRFTGWSKKPTIRP